MDQKLHIISSVAVDFFFGDGCSFSITMSQIGKVVAAPAWVEKKPDFQTYLKTGMIRYALEKELQEAQDGALDAEMDNIASYEQDASQAQKRTRKRKADEA